MTHKPPRTRTPVQRVTLKALAQRLGVSSFVVSSVLSGNGEQRRISEDTQRRVLELARSLDYVPNHLARSLKNQASKTVGLVFHDHYQDWSQEVMEGMEEVFDLEGYMPLTMTHGWQPEREATVFQSMLQYQVEGIICVPMQRHIYNYEQILQRGIPLVFLADRLDEMPDVASVVWDTYAPAREAVRQLAARGRRRIALMGVENCVLLGQRSLKGYLDGLTEAGLPVDEGLITLYPERRDWFTRAEQTLKLWLNQGPDGPDALLAQNDHIGLHCSRILGAMGVDVPGKLALVGMGDLTECSHPGVALASMAEPRREMGREAARHLLQQLRGEREGFEHKTLDHVAYMHRRSAGEI